MVPTLAAPVNEKVNQENVAMEDVDDNPRNTVDSDNDGITEEDEDVDDEDDGGGFMRTVSPNHAQRCYNISRKWLFRSW